MIGTCGNRKLGRGNKKENKRFCINTRENWKIWGNIVKSIEQIGKINNKIIIIIKIDN